MGKNVISQMQFLRSDTNVRLKVCKVKHSFTYTTEVPSHLSNGFLESYLKVERKVPELREEMETTT